MIPMVSHAHDLGLAHSSGANMVSNTHAHTYAHNLDLNNIIRIKLNKGLVLQSNSIAYHVAGKAAVQVHG